MKEKETIRQISFDLKGHNKEHYNAQISLLSNQDSKKFSCSYHDCQNEALFLNQISKPGWFYLTFYHCLTHTYGTEAWNELLEQKIKEQMLLIYGDQDKEIFEGKYQIYIKPTEFFNPGPCDKDNCNQPALLETQILIDNQNTLIFKHCPYHTHGLTGWQDEIINTMKNWREELGKNLDKVAQDDK